MLKKIIPLTLLAMSSAANADSYMGIGLGQSSAEIMPLDLGPGFSTTVTDTATAVKFTGGFEITRNLSMEVGYTYFGEMGVDYTDAVGTQYERAESGASYFAAVGSLPLGGASLFCKVGFASWTLDYSWTDEFGTYTESTSGVDPMVGVGIQLDVSRALSLRAEAERYMDVGDPTTIGQTDIDVLSVSGVFWF